MAGKSHEDARLRWLCRRGMKELDVLLERYLETGYPAAPPGARAAFARLLEYQDPELYALVSGRVVTDDPELADVVERIRAGASS